MNAVDTNVLFYARDPRDPKKQNVAASLITSLVDGVLLWQVACEYLSASRKLEPFGYSRDQAWLEIQKLHRAWKVVLPTWSVVKRAESLLNAYSLSLWDALLIAACIEGGVDRLYTEDFSAYSRIDTLEIVNPFATNP